MKKFFMGLGAGILFFLLIMLGVFLYFNSGSFNISALVKNDLLFGIMDTIKDKSINHAAGNLKLEITDKNFDVKKGSDDFMFSCALCHGEPGYDRRDFVSGMDPQPPDLSDKDEVGDLTNGELFWIIKNGIKMTGMPGFGNIKSTYDIENDILFIKSMQNMKKDDNK